MKFSCLTSKGHIIIVSYTDGEYFIEDSSVPYMAEQIKGKKCRKPREEMPLEIYLDSTSTLQTSRIKKVRTYV